MNNDLYHFGIKGMKWGVRRNKVSSTTGGSGGTQKSPRELKKEAKQLKKAQKEWDDNVKKNWVNAYNKAADESTQKLIPKMNEKYKDYDFSDLSDPKVKKIWDKYMDEYDEKFNEIYSRQFDDMFGKRPE